MSLVGDVLIWGGFLTARWKIVISQWEFGV